MFFKQILISISLWVSTVILGFGAHVNPLIEIKTDHLTYPKKKEIVITLTNSQLYNISTHLGSQTPQFAIHSIEKKKKNYKWKQLHAYCQFPHCTIDSDIPIVLLAGESISHTWEPLVYIHGKYRPRYLRKGTYRLIILYKTEGSLKWDKASSNQFKIK